MPLYLQCIRCLSAGKVSAVQIAKVLVLGEVQVRKDLASVCAAGLPRVGYPVQALRRDMERALGGKRARCRRDRGRGQVRLGADG